MPPNRRSGHSATRMRRHASAWALMKPENSGHVTRSSWLASIATNARSNSARPAPWMGRGTRGRCGDKKQEGETSTREREGERRQRAHTATASFRRACNVARPGARVLAGAERHRARAVAAAPAAARAARQSRHGCGPCLRRGCGRASVGRGDGAAGVGARRRGGAGQLVHSRLPTTLPLPLPLRLRRSSATAASLFNRASVEGDAGEGTALTCRGGGGQSECCRQGDTGGTTQAHEGERHPIKEKERRGRNL